MFCAGGTDTSAIHTDQSVDRHRCDSCQLHCDMQKLSPELRDCNHRRPVMEMLSIPDDMLVNVMMHKVSYLRLILIEH